MSPPSSQVGAASPVSFGRSTRRYLALGDCLHHRRALAVFFVVDQARFVEPEARPIVVHRAGHHDGPRVVVAVHPHARPTAALTRCVGQLGPVGEVTIVAAAPYEACSCTAIPRAADKARAAIERTREVLHDYDPGGVIVPGRLADGAIGYAIDHSVSAVVVPHSRHAMLHRLTRPLTW